MERGFRVQKNEFVKKVGSKIVFYRERCGFTQEKLAELIGVERNTITRYESGLREPKLHLLVEIAKVLEISITDLLPD